MTNDHVASNTVTVPINATSPGIFSADLSGQGDGILVHLNGNLVNSTYRAVVGETLVMYLTGMGALQTTPMDGVPVNAADSVLTATNIQVDGVPVTKIQYSGINPSYPGLYQINFQMPSIPDHGEVTVLLYTTNAATSEITLFAQ